jgi:hypothetical protein
MELTKLQKNIIIEIANSTSLSVKEVTYVYDLCNSFDDTIKVINVSIATAQNTEDIIRVMNNF